MPAPVQSEASRAMVALLTERVTQVVRDLNAIMDTIIERDHDAVKLDPEMLDHLERARGSALRAIATPAQRRHEERECLRAIRGNHLEHVMRQLLVELAFQDENGTTNQPGFALVPDLWSVGDPAKEAG